MAKVENVTGELLPCTCGLIGESEAGNHVSHLVGLRQSGFCREKISLQ